MSKSGLEAVPNDKDGGYSPVDPEVLTKRPEFWDRLHKLGQTLCESFDDLLRPVQTRRRSRARTRTCARVAQIPVSSWIDRSATRDFMQESQTTRCCQIATHPQSATSRLRCLAMWSVKQHRGQLQQFPTLSRDTRNFIHNISALKAWPEHHFVCLVTVRVFHE